MRLTRIWGVVVAILMSSMLLTAGSGVARDVCGPGAPSRNCVSASVVDEGQPEEGQPETVLASAQVPAKGSNASFVSARPPEAAAFRTAGRIATGSPETPITEPMSLVLLGMVLVVAAWTLRHAKAG